MLSQISELLSKIPIMEIAKSMNFIKRGDGKIDPISFVLSFFDAGLHFTIEKWASSLTQRINRVVTSQALQKKLSFRHLEFAEELLRQCINLKTKRKASHLESFLDTFSNVYLGDSTCLALPKICQPFFDGSYSKNGPASTAKIQLTTLLKTDEVVHIDIKSFRDNDQSYSSEIMSIAKPGDLVIRDLGYAVNSTFKQMSSKGIFFISRLIANQLVYSLEDKQIDLLVFLNGHFSGSEEPIDIPILLSKEHKLPVRLVAIKLSKSDYEKKLQKANKDRSKKANHSAEYREKLKYNLYITNVAKNTLTPHEIYKAYKLRWRIEVIFKCWKSELRLKTLFANKQYSNPAAPIMLLYLKLCQITLLQNQLIAPLLDEIRDENGNYKGSMAKIARLVWENINLLIDHVKQFIMNLEMGFYSYQERKSRPTHFEILYTIT